MFIENPCKFCTRCGRKKLLANLIHTRLYGYTCICGNQEWKVEEIEIEVCDCGLPFPKNGYCRFCGAHTRYSSAHT
jgi:hypothetical protein